MDYDPSGVRAGRVFYFMSETNQNPASAPEPIAPIKTAEDFEALPVAASELTQELIKGMPEPTSGEGVHPVETAAPAQPVAPAPVEAHVADQIDGKGQKFDPALHATNEDGTPKRNTKGNFYSRYIGRAGAGRKAGETGEPTEAASFAGVEQAAPSVPPAMKDEAEGAALMLVPTVDGVMQSVFSADIALTDDDKKVITPVLAAYMRSKNMKDIPPGMALVMVAVAVYAPKFQKPTVKERIALIWLKLKNLTNKKK